MVSALAAYTAPAVLAMDVLAPNVSFANIVETSSELGSQLGSVPGVTGRVLRLYSHDSTVSAIATAENKPTKDAGRNIQRVLVEKKRALLEFFVDNAELVNAFADWIANQWVEEVELRAQDSTQVIGDLGVASSESLVQGAATRPQAGRKYVVHVKGFAGGKDKIVEIPSPDKVADLVGRAIAMEEGDSGEDWAEKIAVLGWDGDKLETGYWAEVLPYLAQKVGGGAGNKRLRRSRAVQTQEFPKDVVMRKWLGAEAEVAKMEKRSSFAQKIEEWKKSPRDDWSLDADLDLLLTDIVAFRLWNANLAEQDPLRAKLYFESEEGLRFEGVSSKNQKSEQEKIEHLKSEPGLDFFSWDRQTSTAPKATDEATNPFADKPALWVPTEYYNVPGRIIEAVDENSRKLALGGGGAEPSPTTALAQGISANGFSKTRFFDKKADNPVQRTTLKFGAMVLRNSLQEFKPQNGYVHVIINLGGGPTVQDEFKDLVAEDWFHGVRVYAVDIVRLELETILNVSAAVSENVVQKLVAKRPLFTWLTAVGAPSSTRNIAGAGDQHHAESIDKMRNKFVEKFVERADVTEDFCRNNKPLHHKAFNLCAMEWGVSKNKADLNKMWYGGEDEAEGVPISVFRLSTDRTRNAKFDQHPEEQPDSCSGQAVGAQRSYRLFGAGLTPVGTVAAHVAAFEGPHERAAHPRDSRSRGSLPAEAPPARTFVVPARRTFVVPARTFLPAPRS